MISAGLVAQGVDWYKTSSLVVWLRLGMTLLPGEYSLRAHDDCALLATHDR